ncbi:MAG: histidine kinase [Dermatophilaceae bacterium]
MGWMAADRRHPQGIWWIASDVVIAALFTWITVVSLRSQAYVAAYGEIQGAGWLLALSPNALLLVRRHAPVLALGAAAVLYLLASTTQGDSNAPLALPFFTYSVGLTRPPRVSAPLVGAVALALSSMTFYGPGAPDALVIVVWFLLCASGWALAVAVRRNQGLAERLSQAVDDLEEHQAQVAAEAAADERGRIARELHDAVGHAVNVMVLQAGAARLSHQPDKAFAALQEIEHLGRTALTDLDHMLGLLDDSEVPIRGPAKTSADIATMVEEMRAAGANIRLHDECSAPVGRHVGAAAYRIVQEALTNALKHAGVAHVDVTLSCTPTHLHLHVVDDGQVPPAPRSGRAGRGIAGMTERAKVLGGRLTAGPVEGGGFSVTAVLPLTPQDDVAAPACSTKGRTPAR